MIAVAAAVAFSSAALGGRGVPDAGHAGAVAIEGTVATAGAVAAQSAVASQDTVSFANDVLPIFQNRCAKCHGAPDEDGEPRLESGLNLLEYDKVIAGSEWGTVVEAGDPANSFLLDMIVDQTMPEEGDPVPENEIALIRAWIEAGAPNN
jgi:mono/diheme cytochrome c family protein